MPKNKRFQCSISLYKFGFKNEKMDDYSAKMGNKMLKMKTCCPCSIWVAKKWRFKCQNDLLGKNAGVKAYLKLTPGYKGSVFGAIKLIWRDLLYLPSSPIEAWDKNTKNWAALKWAYDRKDNHLCV